MDISQLNSWCSLPNLLLPQSSPSQMRTPFNHLHKPKISTLCWLFPFCHSNKDIPFSVPSKQHKNPDTADHAHHLHSPKQSSPWRSEERAAWSYILGILQHVHVSESLGNGPTEGVRREKRINPKKKLRGTLTFRVQIQRGKDKEEKAKTEKNETDTPGPCFVRGETMVDG